MTVYVRLRHFFDKTFLLALVIFLAANVFLWLAYQSKADGAASGNAVKVGVCTDGSAFAENFESRVSAYAGELLQIVPYSDADAMRADVATRKLECGYVIPDNASEKITLFVSDFTVAADVSNVLLASTLFENFAGEYGLSVLKNYIDQPADEITSAIDAKNAAYLQKGPFMTFNYMTQKNGETVPATDPLSNARHGLAALFALVAVLLGSSSLVAERRGGLHRRIRAAGLNGGIYFLGNLLGGFVVALIFFAVSGNFDAAAVIYSLCIAALAMLVSLIVRRESAVIFICVLAFLGCAVFGNIFVNVAEISPKLAFLQYLTPTYYYLK